MGFVAWLKLYGVIFLGNALVLVVVNKAKYARLTASE
jgi:hypothetical protein